MRAVVAIACVGLLAWAEKASADPPYTLTVSRHPSVRAFSQNEVKQILSAASAVIRGNGCNATFALKGSVGTFTSSGTPDVITTSQDLDQVHSEGTNVKIVKEIHCCRGAKGNYDGCAWPPKAGSRSIIVTESRATLGNLWAHEFGHRLGLPHKGDQSHLMTGQGVIATSVKLNKAQCRCYLNEGSCTLPQFPPPDPQNRC
jgi:hypothetical protein